MERLLTIFTCNMSLISFITSAIIFYNENKLKISINITFKIIITKVKKFIIHKQSSIKKKTFMLLVISNLICLIYIFVHAIGK